jgi:hypothetical protein
VKSFQLLLENVPAITGTLETFHDLNFPVITGNFSSNDGKLFMNQKGFWDSVIKNPGIRNTKKKVDVDLTSVDDIFCCVYLGTVQVIISKEWRKYCKFKEI